jgi:hypothetical protein
MNQMTKPLLPDDRRRTRSEALKVHAKLRLKHAKETWLYTKPFLLRDINKVYDRPFPTHAAPDVDAFRYTLLKLLWTNAAFFQQSVPLMAAYGMSGLYHASHLALKPLEMSLLADAKKAGVPKPRMIPIPEFDWQNQPPEKFIEDFVRKPFPVVLRGFSKGRPVMDMYKFDNILAKYGEETALLTKKSKDGFEGKLKEVRDPEVYCHNSEFLFVKYPELQAALELERMNPYSDGKLSAYCQLFIGRQGTGSPFHCAAVWNWFHQLDGKKTWWFVDPNHSLYLYPFNRMGQLATTSHCSFPDQYNKEAYPLFEYCPFYQVDLEPGDVLWVPPWWWHAVKNTTQESVAVASRWHVDGIVGKELRWTEEDYEVNRFFSVLLQLSFGSPKQMQSLLEHPSPKQDEHMTLREQKNRFVDKHYRVAEQKVLGIFHKM